MNNDFKNEKGADKAQNIHDKAVSYEDIGFGTVSPEDKYSSVISIPIGKSGTDIAEISLNCGGSKCAPINSGYIIIGRPACGKTALFHGLILNGCMKYSPNDLQFWLLDFKCGGASSNYEHANIPHIKLLSKNNDIGDALCLLTNLTAEIKRRGDLLNSVGQAFRGTNFSDLSEYNKCVDEHLELGEHMSRIIVMIDEAQDMFNDKSVDGDVCKIADLISEIAIKGRYVGIHMIMFAQNLCFGQSHLLVKSFVNHIKGKASFSVDAICIRESGFGERFWELKNEISDLRQGEAYLTNDDVNIVKCVAAYCPQRDLEKYFAEIRNKYSDFKCETKIIDKKNPL